MTDLRKLLAIPTDRLEAINAVLIDPGEQVVNDFLSVVAKYGSPDEINRKHRESRKLDNLLKIVGERAPGHIKDLNWLIEQRDQKAFTSVAEYRKKVLGDQASGKKFADKSAVTLEVSALQYFPWIRPMCERAIKDRTLIPGRFIAVRKMKESETDGDLPAIVAAGATQFLVNATLILVALGVGTAILNLGQRYLTEWIGAHVGYDLRNAIYDRIQYLPFTFHDHSTTGQLINRCIEDVRAVQSFAGDSLVQFVQLGVLSVGVVTILFIRNPWMAAIALLPLVPMTMMTTDFGRRITRLFYDVDNNLGDLSNQLQENVLGVQVVRAFAREPHEIDRFDQINRSYFKSRVKVLGEWSKVMPTTNLLITMGTILILMVGGPLVIHGKMTVGELVAFNAYLLMLSGPVQQLAWLVNALGESEAGAQRVLEILDHEPEIHSSPGATELGVLSGHVEFRNVSLRYQFEKKDALSNIVLTVEPNRLIALIGQTGSGKTSLVNLIPRFYDVSDGAVLVDGVDVRQLELTSLRRQIGIVLQSSLLFSDSIRENIRYGRSDAADAEILAAAKAAQAHDFIVNFSEGYETLVGERGVTLSGGQRQRIAIARALLMNPRILILDDSTSSVDTQTEKSIQEALDRLMEGRTTFVIAHRLATVRRADLILVMADGQIVQRGRHNELLAQGGLYKEIHDLQLSLQNQFINDMEEDDELFIRERKVNAAKGRQSSNKLLS